MHLVNFVPDEIARAMVDRLVFQFRLGLQLMAVILVAACARQPQIPPVKNQPSAEGEKTIGARTGTPFVGLDLKAHRNSGAVIRRLVAGPAAIAGVALYDRIIQIGGQRVTAAQARAVIEASIPGEVLRFHILRDGATLEIDVEVGERDPWQGPSAHPSSLPVAQATPDEAVNWLDDNLADFLGDHARLGAVDAGLTKMFDKLGSDSEGHNKLPVSRSVLTDPGALIRLQDRIMHAAHSTLTDRAHLYTLYCSLLALRCNTQSATPVSADRAPSLADLAAAIGAANGEVRKAFESVPGGRRALAVDFKFLLEEISGGRWMFAQTEVLRGIRAMRNSMNVDLERLLETFTDLLNHGERMLEAASEPNAANSLPAGVAQGEIRAHLAVDGGFIVMGGDGGNRYDMDRIYAVIDTGGDDEYVWRNAIPLETQLIADHAGDDRYDARYGGPGAGWLGIGVLIDQAGDDRYRSLYGGCGAGAFGFGLLIDLAGADRYRCDAWSLGAGIYGGGALVDAGEQTDAYISQIFSQGVGGPRGVGLLVEAGGSELYRANGPVHSAYGTPAAYMGFSQGVGIGLRPHDHGGVGLLADLGGNDRYEGGEFSQGGGYFWGVGLLQDAAGDDLYYGTHYAQGFAAHQAAGLLADLAGNDYYFAATGGAQGAAWDQSLAVLFDGEGDDHYRAQDISQGAAAHQSRAWLYDASGHDDYWSSTTSVQGAAVGNGYHFDADDPVFSFAVLLDAGAGRDRYSSELEGGETRIRENLDVLPDGSGTIGIAVDRGHLIPGK